jgi:ubiquinone/menaquinone biosynthesis C-methylase UbiE
MRARPLLKSAASVHGLCWPAVPRLHEKVLTAVTETGIPGRLRTAVEKQVLSRRGPGVTVPVSWAQGIEPTEVARFWTGHTVNSRPFISARQSARYLEWRFRQYPRFRELSGLYGTHDGETVLDYGCGPGNDVVGFTIHTDAARIVGADVSSAALALAAQRLSLHPQAEGRAELVQLAEDDPALPLEDASVDFLSSQGVIHHTSDPDAVLRELARVTRPGAWGSVMVYNRDSTWFHLATAYEVQVVQGRWADESIDEAFRHNTDGPDCPISRAWAPATFVAMCEAAGFEATFLGGYPSRMELDAIRRLLSRALWDERLSDEHRAFLRELSFDGDGLPLRNGGLAGIGGTYRLRRAA